MKEKANNPRDIINQINSAQREFDNMLSLSANENIMSLTARSYLAGNFSNRYFFHSTNNKSISDFPEFVAASSKNLEDIISQTKSTIKNMFDAKYVNLAPLSGIHAMIMVMLSLTDSGDNIASLDPSQNGHYITGKLIERTGRNTFYLPTNKGEVDTSNIKKFVETNSIKMIYLDGMSYTRRFDIKSIRKAVGNDVIIVLDASHILGLIAGNQFQKPFAEGADIICGNTHKTFPGPHRGIIIARSIRYSKYIKIHESKLYSSNQLNSLMSFAITVFEMFKYGESYAKKTISNAKYLSQFLKEKDVGFDIAKTDNHQVHIIYTTRNQAYELFNNLLYQGINTHVCFTKSEGYFVRLGTQELTRYGMGKKEMETIAEIISKVEKGKDMRKQTLHLKSRFRKVQYSFDNIVYDRLQERKICQ